MDKDRQKSGTTNCTMTGCSGVNVMGNISGQNVTLTANVTPQGELDWIKEKVQTIHERTLTRIKTWTRGMVRTAALGKVLEKLNKGAKWLTIRGSPGEGKTTCAYMALEELHSSGRQVFQVLSPDEYLEVTKVNPVSVIMLDDILGDLEFDHIEWLNWKSVLRQILEPKEHRLDQLEEEESQSEGITVILVGRDYIFKTASRDLGKFSDFISQEKHVVMISQSVVRDVQEKQSILNALVTSNGIKLDEEIIEEICSINVGHGFPHVCRLFVIAYCQNGNISATAFFESPLQFLNETIMKFLDNEEKLILFKELIKGDGKVSIRELGRVDTSYRMIRTADDMSGTYLRKEDDDVKFDHPSIYDCVAFNLCKLYPLFVIENCQLSFIHQRLRLQQDSEEIHRSETDFVVDIPRSYMRDLAKRFAHEIENKHLFYTLSHSACTDRVFVEMMMSMITLPMDRLLNLTDVGETLLTFIASNKSLELFRYIEGKIDLRQNERAVSSVLYGVCKYAASDLLIYLTESGYVLDLDCYNGSGETLAMVAALTRDFKFIDQIMALNPDVCAQGHHNITLLHILCSIGHVSAAERAIAMGAEINIISNLGEIPLHNAFIHGHMDIVHLLIRKGTDIDLKTLVSACTKGDVEFLEQVWDKCMTDGEQSSLGIDCLTAASTNSQMEVMEFLLDKGVSVNGAEKELILPLHEACYHNQTQAVLFLIERGVDVNCRILTGCTPLHNAAVTASHECVDILVKSGVDVDVKNKKLCTPLYITAVNGSKESIGFLLEAGACVNVECEYGYTPIHAAAANGFEDCVEVFLKAGAHVNVKSSCGYTPLHKAALRGSKECVSILLKAGADVNVQNEDGDSPLHTATQTRSTECVDALLKAGADVNIHNKLGYISLHKAIYTKLHNNGMYYRSHHIKQPDTALCQLLISYQSDINKQDRRGNTPLHLLCRVNSDTVTYRDLKHQPASSCCDVFRKLITLLIDHGADVNLLNNRGRPALRGWCKTLVRGK